MSKVVSFFGGLAGLLVALVLLFAVLAFLANHGPALSRRLATTAEKWAQPHN